MQEEQFYQAAIAGGKTVSLTYVKLLTLGPGQVGKSTFLYRLLGLMKGNIDSTPKEDQPQSSTGQSDLRELCIKYKSILAAAKPDLSWELCGLQSQVEGLMWLSSNQSSNEDTQSIDNVLSNSRISITESNLSLHSSLDKTEGKTCTKTSDSRVQSVQQNQKFNGSHVTGNANVAPEASSAHKLISAPSPITPKGLSDLIDKTIKQYEELRIKCKLSLDTTKLHMLFNIADVGGQPAFLDMLPSLTIGPAMYFLFAKLINDSGDVLSIDDLSKAQPVQYRTKDDNEPQECQNYTYTLQEVLFCALSSIACFGLPDKEVEKYITKESEVQKTSSLALLFGTFADKIDDSKKVTLVETESNLRLLLEHTKFYKTDLVIFPNPDLSDGQCFFHINNKTGSEQEIIQYRRIIQELVEQKFRKYDIPAAWLGLSICLKLLASDRKSYKVSIDDCVELGKYFNLNREEVKVALKFLHKYIGLIMYFPNDKHLQNLVICNPQFVFSSISELTSSVYDSSSRRKQLVDVSSKQKRFKETGIFCPKEVTYPDKSSEIMSVNDLVHLLVHLNIATKITASPVEATTVPQVLASEYTQSIDNEDTSSVENVGSNKMHEEYFLPAILKTADISSLLSDVRGVDDEILPEPLCVRFETGYMPMGFTCALSARLMALEQFSLAPEEQTLYKNKMKLRYNGQFNFLMISLPLRCEFQISRHHGTKEFHKQECCPEILKIICEAINFVLQSFQRTFLPEISYDLAFKCPNHPNQQFGHEPLAFVYNDNSQTQLKHIKCLECATTMTDLKPEMKVWFGEVRVWNVSLFIRT